MQNYGYSSHGAFREAFHGGGGLLLLLLGVVVVVAEFKSEVLCPIVTTVIKYIYRIEKETRTRLEGSRPKTKTGQD